MILALTGMNFIQSEAPNGLGVPESSAMILGQMQQGSSSRDNVLSGQRHQFWPRSNFGKRSSRNGKPDSLVNGK